jgi:hypothetical protein
MRVFILISAVLLLVASALPAVADEASHRKLAEEFIVLARTDRLMNTALEQVKARQMEELSKLVFSAQDEGKFQAFRKRMKDYLDGAMNWESMKGAYADVYMKLLTEDELKQAVEFYRGTAGQKLIENADITMKLLKATQERIMELKIPLDIMRMKDDFSRGQSQDKAMPPAPPAKE